MRHSDFVIGCRPCSIRSCPSIGTCDCCCCGGGSLFLFFPSPDASIVGGGGGFEVGAFTDGGGAKTKCKNKDRFIYHFFKCSYVLVKGPESPFCSSGLQKRQISTNIHGCIVTKNKTNPAIKNRSRLSEIIVAPVHRKVVLLRPSQQCM